MKYRALLVALVLSTPVSAHADATGRPFVAIAPGIAVRAGDLVVEPFAATFPATLRGASAVALATDELDENGVPDLACGYAIPGAGAVAVFPGSKAGAPFVPRPTVVEIPVAPDAMATGDFDNDGHRDLVVAATGGHELVLLSGDGWGALALSRVLPLPGCVTALAGGEVNRTDGLADLVVAVDGAAGPQVLVFEGPDGAMRASPEAIPLEAPASSIAIGHLVGNQLGDIAVAAGRELIVVVGRDRHTIAGEAGMRDVAPAALARYPVSGEIRSLAIADFAGDRRADVAALGTNGAIEVFAQSDDGLSAAPELEHPAATGPTGLLAARLGQRHASVVVADAAHRELRAFDGRRAVTIETARPTAATLAMRLNGDALDDLVVLQEGATAPSFVLTSPRATFTVTTTADAGPGSLREAIAMSNAGAEPDLIRFAIDEGPQTITLASPLPEIVSPVTIDATTQPGYYDAPLVRLVGSDSVPVGLDISAGYSTVRGLAVDRFLSEGDFEGRGIFLHENGGNRIESNLIGSAVPGGGEVGNTNGLWIQESPGNTVGGATLSARNVVSGNLGHGVYVLFGSPDTVIRGNVFGMSSDLSIEIPNNNGLFIDNVPRNIVGGTLPSERNIVGRNYTYGIDIISIESAENLVQGNYIGTDPQGRVTQGAFYGIGICGGANNGATANFVGGTATGAGNIISNNEVGVAIGTGPDVTAVENRVLCNRIAGNHLIGIDLADDIYSYDDPGDGDLGPNVQQNAPVLSSLTILGEIATATGSLDSAPNATYRVELFSSAGRTEFGFGDGGTLVGMTNVTTDAAGKATFAADVPVAALEGDSLVATATSAAGNTSEFGRSIALVLTWETPDPNGGDTPPPRTPSIRIDDDVSDAAPATVRGGFQGYNVYRGTTSSFQIGPDTRFRSLVPQREINTFAFPTGSFFRITAVYDSGESAPTPAIGGGIPPQLTSMRAKGEKIVADGGGFSNPVIVFLDGIPFRTAARVKRASTRVLQRGPLITGDGIQESIERNAGVATVLMRTADGGTTIRRVT